MISPSSPAAGSARQDPSARWPPSPSTRTSPACLAGQNSGTASPRTEQCEPASSFSPARRPRKCTAPCTSSTGRKTFFSACPHVIPPRGTSLTAHIERILLTRPLARISLASDPPVTALLLHRDVERLHVQADRSIEATLPPGSTRIF